MLDLALAGPGFTTARFAFGGVAFEVEADADARWALCDEFERHCLADAGAKVAATVACAVRLDRRLSSGATGPLAVQHRGTGARVTTDDAQAELFQRGPGNYLASARVALRRDDSMPQGADAVVLGVTAAVLERAGGLCLHAAAIELDGAVVLFLGPSGAGKSTAAFLTAGGRVFAFDRVSVVPEDDGSFSAWSLPGGNAVDVVRSAERRLPLAGICRVRQSTGSPRIAELTQAAGLFALRESVWSTDLARDAEERRIDNAMRLLASVPVAELHTVLGQSHAGLLRQVFWAGASPRAVSQVAEGVGHEFA